MSNSDPPAAGPATASGSDATARVELRSRTPSLELTVVASDFRPLASGMGHLSVALPPGIYQVVARAGPVVERKLIRLEVGGEYRDDDVAVAFPTPAPVRETSTSHEYQEVAAERASNAIVNAAGPPSGLVIIVRDVRGYQGPPLETGDVACFGLLDESLTPVEGFEQGWTIDTREAVATWSRRLPPGGYVLRTDPSRVSGSRKPSTTQAFDQSAWLSADWQTLVFITTGPGGPRTSEASVHMTTMSMGWSPYETDVGHALELASLGLREGRSVLPDDLMNVLLHGKFVNPMLGIVGAHSLLLRSKPDASLLELVLHNLDELVPGHPDVLALRWSAVSSAADAANVDAAAASVPAGGATWPPVLLPSYRALIAMDAAHPSAIGDGSLAERAAANLLEQGIWTSWMPLSQREAVPVERRGRRRWARRMDVAGVLPALAEKPSLIDEIPRADPATARVAAYLGGLAALEGPSGRASRFATLSPQEIGLATTLPVATVDRALKRIAATLTPSPWGILKLSSPFLAAGALLLAGVIGAVAWCAGSDACPLRPAVPAPTAIPTAAVTPQPTATPPPEPTLPPPEPTPIVLDSPARIGFGPVTIGGARGSQRLRVNADEPVTLTFEVTDNPDGAFAVDDRCRWTATPVGRFRCVVDVTFTPVREGEYLGSITLNVADDFQAIPEDIPRSILLTGEGLVPFLEFDKEMTFGEHSLQAEPLSKDFVIRAIEPIDLRLEVIEDETGSFYSDRACVWAEPRPGHFECTVSVTFRPQAEGELRATLSIRVGELDPYPVYLFGSGFVPIP